MKAEELMGLADRAICQMFSDTGHGPEARVWIHTKGKVVAVPCKPHGEEEERMLRGVICGLIYSARKAGIFEGAVLMAEAWMSIVEPGQKPYDRPVHDPNRIEVAIILAYGEDGRVQSIARRIERRNGKRTIGALYQPYYKEGMVYASWLDSAFQEPEDARRAN